jgi:hypothetical protein
MGPLHTHWQLSKSDHKNIPRHRTENSLHTHQQYQTHTATNTTWHRKWHHRHLQTKVWVFDKVYIHQTSLHFIRRTSSTRMCRGGQMYRIMHISSTLNVLKLILSNQDLLHISSVMDTFKTIKHTGKKQKMPSQWTSWWREKVTAS